MHLYVRDRCGFYFSPGTMGSRARDKVLCVRTYRGMCGHGAGMKGRSMEKGRREDQFKLAPAISNRLLGPVILRGGSRSISKLHMCRLRLLCPWGRMQEARGMWHGCEVRC